MEKATKENWSPKHGSGVRGAPDPCGGFPVENGKTNPTMTGAPLHWHTWKDQCSFRAQFYLTKIKTYVFFKLSYESLIFCKWKKATKENWSPKHGSGVHGAPDPCGGFPGGNGKTNPTMTGAPLHWHTWKDQCSFRAKFLS